MLKIRREYSLCSALSFSLGNYTATTAQRWSVDALRKKCECQRCLNGEATTHNDDSHDQSLQQKFHICGKSVEILGGTTKCARVASKWLTERDEEWGRISALEIGSGTGLVGITLSLLGCKSVTFTDQEPVLDTIRHNVEGNLEKMSRDNSRTRFTVRGGNEVFTTEKVEERGDDSGLVSSEGAWDIEELFWGTLGSEALIGRVGKRKGVSGPQSGHHWDVVIGSDLIFAHENIEPLVQTYEKLCGPNTKAYLVTINRFDWEARFFKLMEEQFDEELVLQEGDIYIHAFTKRRMEV
ncbi:hypothetical protein SARC_11480 [Sphaeroforma arctica JP610]|uniref:Uncharacterized protein n=1 Tax=Sphaeroforma arctica JP610 TaxID=667725 RepID=A0A0L0FGV8_9EUKA|nr:hypothetical protein SARC_11480 [Sphaeroforma arctica JP610]KNC76007.1 hypothetical protein SARC_11480 [Sphaeroforma arctica JP610]|eukprot:XP_014149909.1 hypothetical protein SARC_11480 [Sphaeroforma arctica JP610]